MKHLIKHTFTAIFCFFILSCTALAKPDNLQQAYYNWCASIEKAKGDPQVITPYYAPNAVLLPTLSHEVFINHNDGLVPYFKKFLSHPNLRCTPKTLISHRYADLGVNSGFYQFTYLDHDKTKTVRARFTFVYEKIDGQWLIVTHHSSLTPDAK